MDRALDGIRVLDLSSWWAGPMATMMFADMGAEVIKIEAIQRPDNFRGTFGRRDGERWWETSPLFNSCQRNKLGLTLNLTDARGVELFKRLVALSDIVWENYSPRVMPQLGLDYEVLREINPRLIMVSQTGFGQTGPWRDYASFANVAEALAGLAHLTGRADGPPCIAGALIGDSLSASHAAMAALVALDERERTGHGQHIDLSQLETNVPPVAEAIADHQMNGRVWSRIGNRHPRMAPHGCYPARGEDRWVVIAVTRDAEWQRLVTLLGEPEWARDARLATVEGRLAATDELDERIAAWTEDQDRDALAQRLLTGGVCAAPVQGPPDVLTDPHLEARGFFQTVDRKVVGPQPYPTLGIRFSKTPAPIRTPAPLLGEHNHAVLKRLLGLSERDFAELEQSQVIGTAPVNLE